MVSPRLFVFGLGYVGVHVARLAQTSGWEVGGSSRTPAKAAALRQSFGIHAHALESGASLAGDLRDQLSRSTHVLSTIPPIEGMHSDPIVQHYGEDLLSSSVQGQLLWAGYLSTTGVYGDHAGAWVDETSETRAPPNSSAAGS